MYKVWDILLLKTLNERNSSQKIPVDMERMSVEMANDVFDRYFLKEYFKYIIFPSTFHTYGLVYHWWTKIHIFYYYLLSFKPVSIMCSVNWISDYIQLYYLNKN